jgi:cellulose synthase/poly-beta-1,6-N-acetylglucosamine synthase-like glycosyltransferase
MPFEAMWVAVGLAVVIVSFFLVSRVIGHSTVSDENPSRWQNIFSLLFIFFMIFAVFVTLYFFIDMSVFAIILLAALLFTLLINFITVPLAIYHKLKEKNFMNIPLSYFPKVSIIVPAYNEEQVVARTIENLIEAYYPNKEIIVVDDGSTDRTYEIAKSYAPRITAVQRPNGGKFAALNTGISFASGEIIISVDADSLLARNAVVEAVRYFEDPEVGGVAGNLQVFNDDKFITRLQYLEYINQIQIVRRAFENFGSITVAPGAFSAFRREAMKEIGNYDPDRLLEDFDLTIKLQKTNRVLQGSSGALCYTEAPESIRDVYKQRLSWFRGDFQNFWKHRDAFFNPRFGFMHKFTLPYMLISMTLVPLASIFVIVTSIMMILNGQWMVVLYAGLLFILLQFLFSALGIKIAGADMKLLVYSPLYIVGYKHFLDFTMLKALFDIILGRGHYMKRERVSRIGGMQEVKPRRETSSATAS